MRRRVGLFGIICLITLGVAVGGVVASDVGALSYQSSVGVGFTFEPTLNVTLSNSDLVINNLSPGARSDSNIITVGVSTNAAYGYDLLATVGNASNATTELKNGNNSFTSLSSNTATLASFDDNKWGYSYSTDSGTSWVSGDQGSASTGYAGLPLYTGTGVKMASVNSNTDSSVQFKIAAKAGATQASGEYTNVVNFAAVSKVGVVTLLDAFVASNATQQNGYYTMQGMTPTICNAADVGSSIQLMDVRDNKLYWVAKLKDNNCWMTQNLDLNLSSTVALNSVTSDIDPTTYNTGIYTQANGYSKDETTGVVSWLPSTIVNVDGGNGGTTPVQRADTIVMNNNSAPNWAINNNNPYSADPGERYRYTNPSSYSENTYTSLATCASSNNNDTVGCQHSHFGNYYNWPAAAATNDASTAPNGSTWSNSICPKGWDLPANGKYRTLMAAQEVYPGSGNTYSTDGFNKLRTAPLYFQRFGYVLGGSLNGLGSYGRYWSSTVYISTNSYYLYFNGSNIDPSYLGNRFSGFSVRCMASV